MKKCQVLLAKINNISEFTTNALVFLNFSRDLSTILEKDNFFNATVIFIYMYNVKKSKVCLSDSALKTSINKLFII